jgi:3-hydroxyacyl-[acyl-carrier-protein] dehydratase
MDPHFRAFSFVDRIVPGAVSNLVRGAYVIPAALRAFPLSLVTEAVGQLAAWGAMERTQFQRRPVAGLAGQVELLRAVEPGQTLTLEAELETVDHDAIAYSGMASVEGTPVAQLHHCVGPMLPAADFDDPEALRRRHKLLCGAGAEPGVFPGIPEPRWELGQGERGRWRQATLQVPAEAALFQDHFPRRPVFPGTLILQTNLLLAAAISKELPLARTGNHWGIAAITDVKLRTFIAPGELLTLEATLAAQTDATATLRVDTRRQQRTVGAAQIHLAAQGPP